MSDEILEKLLTEGLKLTRSKYLEIAGQVAKLEEYSIRRKIHLIKER